MPKNIRKKGERSSTFKLIELYYLDEQIVLPVPVVILSACRKENESQQKDLRVEKSIKSLQFLT